MLSLFISVGNELRHGLTSCSLLRYGSVSINTLYAKIICPIADALGKDHNMIVRIQTCHPQKLRKKPRETSIISSSKQANKLVLFAIFNSTFLPNSPTSSLNYLSTSTQPWIRALESTLGAILHIYLYPFPQYIDPRRLQQGTEVFLITAATAAHWFAMPRVGAR